jgi:hypothetical protein
MGLPRLLPLRRILGISQTVGTVAHYGFGKDPDRGRNPRLGYLDQSYGKGAPAGARNGQRRCAALCAEGVRGMPRGNGDPGPMRPR